MILKLEQFVDTENGVQINALSPAFPAEPKAGTLEALPPVKYTSVANVRVQTQMGPTEIPISIEFPDGYTLRQCFAEFEDFAKKGFEEFKQKMEEERKKLIVPPQSGIIV